MAFWFDEAGIRMGRSRPRRRGYSRRLLSSYIVVRWDGDLNEFRTATRVHYVRYRPGSSSAAAVLRAGAGRDLSQLSGARPVPGAAGLGSRVRDAVPRPAGAARR